MNGIVTSIFTNKGGTGKTTTVVSLGQALARENKKVLLVDMDSQCNTTTRLLQREPRYSILDTLTSRDKDISIEDCIYVTEFQHNLYCLPNTPDSVALEPALIKKGIDGFSILRSKLRDYAVKNFDFTFIDNPPNHGIFVINSLFTSDFAVVPTDAGSKDSIRGLQKAIQFINDINNDGNSDLRFLRLLLTKVDKRTSVSRVIKEQLESFFGDKMFKTIIPLNVDFQKAELSDQTIFKYNLKAAGTRAYKELAKEFISILKSNGIKTS